jgi:hypothetical protein
MQSISLSVWSIWFLIVKENLKKLNAALQMITYFESLKNISHVENLVLSSLKQKGNVDKSKNFNLKILELELKIELLEAEKNILERYKK